MSRARRIHGQSKSILKKIKTFSAVNHANDDVVRSEANVSSPSGG
jgi:hypothetical protein